MALTRELCELVSRLDKGAGLAQSGPMRDLERSVCGCDYGSTGGTTRARCESLALVLGADALSERLKRRQVEIDALDAGFLRRELFVAESP